MHTKTEVYSKIKEVYPDIGDLGKDIIIEYDTAEHAWLVDITKGAKHLKTYLEESDADVCIDRGRCFGLGIQIGQLRDNLLMM